jgi:hypothetical protein
MDRCLGVVVGLVSLIVLFLCCCLPIAAVVFAYGQWG